MSTISFSGRDWIIKSGSGKGPGPNNWDAKNVWVDNKTGYLHLKLTHIKGTPFTEIWSCAEVYTTEPLHFGNYQFVVEGRTAEEDGSRQPLDKLDENVVLGLFSYPLGGDEIDETNEIDIEFAKFGDAKHPNSNYTVWPSDKKLGRTTHSFTLDLEGERLSTHQYTRTPDMVYFTSRLGGAKFPIGDWRYDWLDKPDVPDPSAYISKLAMPVHINLWLFQGIPPTNGKEVEVIISSFNFTPLEKLPRPTPPRPWEQVEFGFIRELVFTPIRRLRRPQPGDPPYVQVGSGIIGGVIGSRYGIYVGNEEKSAGATPMRALVGGLMSAASMGGLVGSELGGPVGAVIGCAAATIGYLAFR